MSDQKPSAGQTAVPESVDGRHGEQKEPETPERPVSSTKFTDINDDCLVLILKKLKLEDLLNMADASKCLKPAVDQAYASLFGLSINIISMEPSRDRTLKMENYSIYISDLSTCLKFLRCFGHLITVLNISYLEGDRCHHNEVDRYLNEYCADSLLKIKFDGARPWTMENISKSFQQLYIIEIRDSRLSANLTNFNRWFPKLGMLEFAGQNIVENRNYIEMHFPELFSFSIQMNKSDNSNLEKSNIAEFFRLNPNIFSLKICGDVLDAKFLHSISEHLQMINNMTVTWHPKCFNHNGPIHFRNAKKLELEIYGGDNRDVYTIPTPRIPFSFDHLERLKLNLGQYYLSDDTMIFINMHPTLKELFLTNEDADIFAAIGKLNLTNLVEEIILDVGYFTVDDALDFIRNCESVKNFTFRGSSFSMYDQLRAILGEEWRISYENDVLKLQLGK